MHPAYSLDAPRPLILAAGWLVNVIVIIAVIYSAPYYWKQPYHTSALTGAQWVKELITGHSDKIHNELGMGLHVFLVFVEQLRQLELENSRWVLLEEKAAIFLY
ncbi:hypothetical protein K435DRAFT_703136, partial [Dendrothele bispora CBS 962.96]